MLYAIVAVLVLILDQAVKYWTTVGLALDTGVKTVIPGVLSLVNIHNSGAAFGILQNARWLFVLIAVVFVAAVVVALTKNVIKGELGRWSAILVMAGAVGNCIDRVMNGYVVDMFRLDFMNFAVFNIADIFITVCGILFCVYVIFGKDFTDDKKSERGETPKKSRRPSKKLPPEAARPVEKKRPAEPTRIVEPKRPTEVKHTTEVKRPVEKRSEPLPVKPDDEGVRTYKPKSPAPSAPAAVVKSAAPAAAIKPLNSADPFAEWGQKKAPEATPAVINEDVDKTAVFTAVAPEAPKPAPQPAPKPAPAAKTEAAREFTLEDILAEYSDK